MVESKKSMSNSNQNEDSRKFFTGTMILPFTVQVTTGVNNKSSFTATLESYNEEKWQGLIKWESTRKQEYVDLDRIIHPEMYGSPFDCDDIDDEIKNRGQRSARLQIKEYKRLKQEERKKASNNKTNVIKKVPGFPSTSNKNKRGRPRKDASTSKPFSGCEELKQDWYAEETEKKYIEYRKLFDLPQDGKYTLSQLHTGFINAIQQRIKSSKDANLLHR